MDTVRISIIVPCYNCEHTIENTVSGLLNQKISDVNGTDYTYQIVLVNDGATDSTAKMVADYAARYENIRAIHKENGGLVSAWKTGVINADGDYIAFCDSDDYIEPDFIDVISHIIDDNNPDIITFGMTYEYDNGDKQCEDTRLGPGLYERDQIEKSILPRLLSSGDMQSELVGSSRCNKVFRRTLLMKIIDDIPESVSFGEDDLTSFAAILNANSIYSMQGFYPYHYIRNSNSMIGAYDARAFEKIDLLYHEMSGIAEKYCYIHKNQVKKGILSILFLYIKKEICKNPGGYKSVNSNIGRVLEGDTYIQCYSKEAIQKYGLTKRMFAGLIANKHILLAYLVARGFENIRGRNI